MTISGNINITCDDCDNIQSFTIFDNNTPLNIEYSATLAGFEAIHNVKPDAHSALFNEINSKNETQDSQIADLVSTKANRSELPTVNNATLTITQGGTSKGTFTANASTDVTIGIDNPAWGSITGTLSNQTDLDTALSGKANTSLSNTTDAGKIVIAHNAMPSSTIYEFTLGASGATYTAPADGYFCYITTNGATANHYEYIHPLNGNYTGLNVYTMGNAGVVTSAFMPACKGDKVTLSWFGTGNQIEKFYFVYAKGSESEAS